MRWWEYLISILVELATVIPVLIELVKYIKQAMKEKNWRSILSLIMKYMEVAEQNYSDGKDKREYVADMVMVASNEINYELDKESVYRLIDDFCKFSKSVNASPEKEMK